MVRLMSYYFDHLDVLFSAIEASSVVLTSSYKRKNIIVVSVNRKFIKRGYPI